MNERILELKRLALAWCDENIPEQVSEETGYGEAWEDKFAEMIVEECARVANDSNQSKNRAVGVSVGDVVRNHFGVDSQ